LFRFHLAWTLGGHDAGVDDYSHPCIRERLRAGSDAHMLTQMASGEIFERSSTII
jgi:hypothetical protein